VDRAENFERGVGTEDFQNFFATQPFLDPLCRHSRKNFEGGRDGGFSEIFSARQSFVDPFFVGRAENF